MLGDIDGMSLALGLRVLLDGADALGTVDGSVVFVPFATFGISFGFSVGSCDGSSFSSGVG